MCIEKVKNRQLISAPWRARPGERWFCNWKCRVPYWWWVGGWSFLQSATQTQRLINCCGIDRGSTVVVLWSFVRYCEVLWNWPRNAQWVDGSSPRLPQNIELQIFWAELASRNQQFIIRSKSQTIYHLLKDKNKTRKRRVSNCTTILQMTQTLSLLIVRKIRIQWQ